MPRITSLVYDLYAQPNLGGVRCHPAMNHIPALLGQSRMGCGFPPFLYYVDYQPNRVNYYPLPLRTYGISKNFSGCAMAYFVFMGQPYIAHIALDGGGSARDMWNNFVIMNRSRIGQYVIFRPYAEGNRFEREITRFRIPTQSVVGIITPDLRCFSLAAGFNFQRQHIVEETDQQRKHLSRNLSLERDSDLRQFLIPRLGHGVVW